ncbi:GNAT family N-acetyltransferase [Clostridium sp.]|uniref:GNAT family N-acetyltransferase n=1 Tax=Clostridium sp. TaxID=1506 RepID=UPI0032174AA8
MIIRELKEEEFVLAVDLLVDCWDEELAGVAPNRRVKKEELDSMIQWLQEAEENNDIRLIYGAFENDKFMGFVGASIAEEYDVEKGGVELNYLFVHKEYRGHGISLQLTKKILDYFISKDFDKLVVYNHHCAPSNAFYRKFGGTVLRHEIQGTADEKLLVDIFIFDAKGLRKNIETVICNRYI